MVIYVILTIICGVFGFITIKKLQTQLTKVSNNFDYVELTIQSISKDLKHLEIYVNEINQNLDTKDFKSIVDINKRLKILENFVKVGDEKILTTNKRIFNDFEKVFNNLNQLKMNIRALGNDPGTINRY